MPMQRRTRLSQGIKASSSTSSQEKTRLLPGVHHAKYILIFTSSAIWVVITTANLTAPSALNAYWHQRFPLSCTSIFSPSLPTETNDFGEVLSDFLTQQSSQIHPLAATLSASSSVVLPSFDVLQWVHNQTGVPSLLSGYDYSQAEVRLVSTVPGRYTLRKTSSSEEVGCIECIGDSFSKASTMDYGLRRLRTLLQQRMSTNFPSTSARDTLFLQPTSIGAGVNHAYLSRLLSHLLPEAYWDDLNNGGSRQEMYHLVWPSEALISSLHHCVSNDEEEEQYDSEEEDEDGTGGNGPLFLSPEVLATLEPDVHAQMRCYAPLPRTPAVAPHLKTYLRLNNSASSSSKSSFSRSCSCAPVHWLALTSACLSLGAMGREMHSAPCSSLFPCGASMKVCSSHLFVYTTKINNYEILY